MAVVPSGYAAMANSEVLSGVYAAGGMIIQAHPFRGAPWITEPAPVFEHSADGVEAFHCHNPTSGADRKALAQKIGWE